jgi:ATP-dependent Clp protease ATP-binding subunit ClpA
VTIELTEAATQHLAREGYDPDNGARPLARVIQDELKRPLGDELLFGALEKGGHVTVDAAEGKLKLVFGPSQKGRSAS